MAIKRTFYITLILFLFVWAFTALDKLGSDRMRMREMSMVTAFSPDEIEFLADNPAIQAQIAEIDKQIAELEAMKRGFEARALRHEDQAQRLQFIDRAVLETRRHNELADENRAKAEKVQQEIDRLQAERRKLLQTG